MYGNIRRNPKKVPNPLLCNLKTQGSTQDTTEALVQILDDMTSKIPEHQTMCSAIRGIGSHRVVRFDLTECETIKELIISIQNGSKTGRRDETLLEGDVSVYDEGTKDYIESNRLLDFASEFLWKARERDDRPVQVNGLNETKLPLNYETY